MNYADVFSPNLVMELSKNIGINKYVFELVNGKQSFYGSIDSLDLMELETIKVYIKTYLKTRFIQLFKFLAGAPIFFDKKLDKSL